MTDTAAGIRPFRIDIPQSRLDDLSGAASPGAERDHHVVHWNEAGQGGHFLAMERPEPLIEDVRAFFRKLG
ncbi:hypothetical protein [Actinomadura sp. 21ATH]|uniref:hypothetical protein n=1 Tax=Actinomadura sp. 21ATH TaxID=1735444 RepID=UPI0035C040D3